MDMMSEFFRLKVIGASATRRYGGKNVLMVSVLLWSLSTFLVPLFAHSIYSLVLARVILGLGEGLGNGQNSLYCIKIANSL